MSEQIVKRQLVGSGKRGPQIFKSLLSVLEKFVPKLVLWQAWQLSPGEWQRLLWHILLPIEVKLGLRGCACPSTLEGKQEYQELKASLGQIAGLKLESSLDYMRSCFLKPTQNSKGVTCLRSTDSALTFPSFTLALGSVWTALCPALGLFVVVCRDCVTHQLNLFCSNQSLQKYGESFGVFLFFSL